MRSSRVRTSRAWPRRPARQLRKATKPTDLIVVGRGNLGRSLARAWRRTGHRVRLVEARGGVPSLVAGLRSRPSSIVFLTVPDGAIATVARAIAKVHAMPPSVAFVHCSGALGLVALAGVAVEMLESIGWSEGDAVAGLVPLMEGALAEVARRGPVGALTGPIRRGDVETVTRHLEALAGRRRMADLYRMLGAIALEIANKAGLEPVAAGRVKRALTRNVAATRRRRQG